MIKKYIGQKKFLERLKSLEKKSHVSLVVIKGRRRVGKSLTQQQY